MGKKMGGSFGQGAFAVYVVWKARDDNGHRLENLYRYSSEAERDKKLRDFKNNSKVFSARKESGYASW